MKNIFAVIFCFLLVGCQSPTEKPTEVKPNQTQEKPATDHTVMDELPDTETNDQVQVEGNQTESEQNTKPDDKQEDEELASKFIPSRLFFYDFEQEQMCYIDTEVEVFGGGYINALTHALKNDQFSDDLIIMNDETLVTSAKLDETTGILDVYFNESFYASTNLGSRAEVGFIDALVNTYGYNYNVTKVRILVDGKLYSDQRGEMEDGYFSVTSNIAIPFE